MARTASPAQCNFIKSLTQSRQIEPKWVTMAEAEIEAGLDFERASKWIEWLQAQPKIERPAVDTSHVKPGIWSLPDGTVCMVKVSKTSHKPYAMRVTVQSGVKPVSTFVAGLIYDVARTGSPMDVAAAAQIGLTTGWCVCCGRELTDPDSVKAGIGPVCASRQSALVGAP